MWVSQIAGVTSVPGRQRECRRSPGRRRAAGRRAARPGAAAATRRSPRAGTRRRPRAPRRAGACSAGGVRSSRSKVQASAVAVVSWPASSRVTSWSRSSRSLMPPAVLEAGREQQREDVVALGRAGSARRSAISASSSSSTAPDLRLRAASSGPARPKRRASRTPNCSRGEAAAVEQAAQHARAGARAGAVSVTPKTARRITSSVTACIRGWIANASPAARSRSRARRSPARAARRRACARRGTAAASPCAGRGARSPRAAAPTAGP